jgi:hypothetical protein
MCEEKSLDVRYIQYTHNAVFIVASQVIGWMHESVDYVVIQPVACEAALKIVLCIYKCQLMEQGA